MSAAACPDCPGAKMEVLIRLPIIEVSGEPDSRSVVK